MTHPALDKARDDRTLGQRIADKIAKFGGSWPFIFCAVGFIAVWMLVNTVILSTFAHKGFDPYPFILLNLILSCLAGLQAPIIMMSQNRAAARDEALASHHYDETRRIDTILQQNTALTVAIHKMSEELHAHIVSEAPVPPPVAKRPAKKSAAKAVAPRTAKKVASK